MDAKPLRIEDCPRTKDGWIPMAFFREAFFQRRVEDFLVWLADGAPGDTTLSAVDMAVWDDEDDSVIFVGEWRDIDNIAHLEPVAFMPMPDPGNGDELRALAPAA